LSLAQLLGLPFEGSRGIRLAFLLGSDTLLVPINCAVAIEGGLRSLLVARRPNAYPP
jgi:hypothetical protein